METVISKKEIIDWISNLEDESILVKIQDIKRKATFNFDEEFKKGISGEELKTRLSNRIKSLPWKK